METHRREIEVEKDKNCENGNVVNKGQRGEQDIKCYYTNAQSLLNKKGELQALVEEKDIKIVGITETWGTSDRGDAEYQLDNFVLYRKDKTQRRGGGVMLFIHESLVSTPAVELNQMEFEEMI